MRILPLQPKSNFDRIKGLIQILQENSNKKFVRTKSNSVLKNRG